MAEYIERKALINELSASCMPIDDREISGLLGCDESIRDVINAMPAADVRLERHGEWSKEEVNCDFSEVSSKIKTICLFKCSLCGHMSLEQCANYCHNCGAKNRREGR